MLIVAFTFSLRSVPRDHRELPHTRRDQVRVPHALLHEARQELSRLAPQLDTQNYMSLIRAAGHNKCADAPSSCWRSSKMQVTRWTSLCTISCWMLASCRRPRPCQGAHDNHARKVRSIRHRALQHRAERPYLGWRDSRCLHVAQADGVGRHHTENSFGKVPGVVIEELAKNCTALTTVYVDSCGKATDAGIEALAKNCTSLTTIYLNRCAWARMRASRPLPRTAHL